MKKIKSEIIDYIIQSAPSEEECVEYIRRRTHYARTHIRCWMMYCVDAAYELSDDIYEPDFNGLRNALVGGIITKRQLLLAVNKKFKEMPFPTRAPKRGDKMQRIMDVYHDLELRGDEKRMMRIRRWLHGNSHN